MGKPPLTPAAYSMIADYFPADKLGRAIGVYATGLFLGAGLAMVLGGYVVSLVSDAGAVHLPLAGTLHPWQLTFLIVGAPGVLLAVLIYATVREPSRRNQAAAGRKVPIRELGGFLWLNRKAFGCIFFGYAAGGMAFNGFLFWNSSAAPTAGTSPTPAWCSALNWLCWAGPESWSAAP